MSDDDEREAAEVEVVRAPFPLVRKLHRTLTHDYAGPAYVWDIDKTWLDTRFSQLRGMLKIPFEFAIDKHAIPGTTALLHGLREGPSGREHRPLYFITASPPFIRKSIERKMLLDGIEFDGILYKDQIEVFRRRHFDSLREHTAFKLSALLLLARAFPARTEVYLFGDDAERDPLIYCLFADICAGRLRDAGLRATLIHLGVRASYADDVTTLAGELPARERVAGVFIHLVRDPQGGTLRSYDARVLGYPSAAAVARRLCTIGLLSAPARDRVTLDGPAGEVIAGATSMPVEGRWTPAEFLPPA
ncbi:phosphatase domain-containing protein [Nannocystaceae bacterium ST9]